MIKKQFAIIFVSLLSFFITLTIACQNAVVLKHKTIIEVSKNRLSKEISYDIQINNTKGDAYCSIAISYNKQIKISNISATITDLTGNVLSKLKPADIKKKSVESDEAFFMDAMQYEFSLHHFRYPYILKYSYREETSEFLDIDSWCPLIDSEIETKNAELTLIADASYKFRYFSTLMDKPTTDTLKNIVTYNWKTSHKAIPTKNIYMPKTDDIVPILRIVPDQFLYQKQGSFNSWESYGNWQFIINSKLQTLSNNEKASILNTINEIPDTLERIKALYHRLQDQTRYVNISLKKGGMIPTDAILVSECKYGDCKGLTNYFRAVLNIAGIKSFYTDIHADNKIASINTSFPSQQFNHVILCVPYKKDTIWLDCTSKGPFGYVGSLIQNRPVLVINEFNSKIKKTPALTELNVKVERNFHIKADPLKGNFITASCTYRGNEFEYLHYLKKQPSTNQLEPIIEDFGIRNAEIESHNISQKHRDSTCIQLSYNALSNKYIQKIGTDIFIQMVSFNLPNFEKPAQRNYPVCFDYPIAIADSQFFEFEYELPAINPFPDINIKTPFGSYSKAIVFRNNGIEITKSLLISAGKYPKTKYADFYNFIEQIKENESNNIVIKRK